MFEDLAKSKKRAFLCEQEGAYPSMWGDETEVNIWAIEI